MSYVIVEYDELMSQGMAGRGLFSQMVTNLEQVGLKNTQEVWPGLTYGGFTPGSKQFGRTTIIPRNFAGFGQTPVTPPTAAQTLATWIQDLTTTGSQILIQGQRAGQITPEDWRTEWIGLAFPQPPHITELRWEIGDTRYPRVNIEECFQYNKPAVIFENGYDIPAETFFELRGYIEAGGQQQIVMLGFQYYRRKDMALSATGSITGST